jgi:hypothetical protein
MKQKPQQVVIKGKNLSCPFCNGELFWKKRTLMNTTGMTLMGMEWMNTEAQNFICDNCGYIYWFWFPKVKKSNEVLEKNIQELEDALSSNEGR